MLGDVTSSGIEFELGALLVNNDDLTWNMNANLSTVNTEITDLGGFRRIASANFRDKVVVVLSLETT